MDRDKVFNQGFMLGFFAGATLVILGIIVYTHVHG